MHQRNRFPPGIFLLLAFLLVGRARMIGRNLVTAEPPDSSTKEVPPKTYGTQDLVFYRIGAVELLPVGPFETSLLYSGGRYLRYPSSAAPSIGRFLAVAHLPQGADVTYFELDACDEDGGNDLFAALIGCDYLGNCQLPLATISSATFSTACTSQAVTLASAYRVNNFLSELRIQVDIPAGGHAAVAGVILGYRLGVSPAPATATFADVPTTHLYFRAIEALADAGITQGCGGGNFCPNQTVTRGELAKFLANALGLHWK
jgi:hypothetical protein